MQTSVSIAFHPKGTASGSAPADSPWRLVLDRDYKADRSNNSFVGIIGLEDAVTLKIRAQFDPDMFTAKQVRGFTESVFIVVELLSESKNWDREVREVLALLLPRESRL